MDRITQSLFEDFIKRFSLEEMDGADAFERFAAYCVLTPILAETFDPEDVTTGAGTALKRNAAFFRTVYGDSLG